MVHSQAIETNKNDERPSQTYQTKLENAKREKNQWFTKVQPANILMSSSIRESKKPVDIHKQTT